jgi:hypothetical protein
LGRGIAGAFIADVKCGSPVWPFDQTVLYPHQAPNEDGLKPAIAPDTYAALLPLVWSLLTQAPGVPLLQRPSPKAQVDGSIPSTIGVAFIEHLLRTAGDSATRRLGNEFVARLCLVSVAALGGSGRQGRCSRFACASRSTTLRHQSCPSLSRSRRPSAHSSFNGSSRSHDASGKLATRTTCPRRPSSASCCIPHNEVAAVCLTPRHCKQ